MYVSMRFIPYVPLLLLIVVKSDKQKYL